MPTLRLWIVAMLMLAVPGVPVLAQDAPPPPHAAASGLLRLLPPPSTTQHTLKLGRHELRYTATAGTLPLRDAKGETTAALFNVAYTQDPPSPQRPITFVFNGGPGAASAFLNLGAIGPRLVAFAQGGGYLPPPARLIDNPDSWLAFTDLVFVDPVGTGYSRPAVEGDEGAQRFYGVRQDVAAMAAFIRLYLAQHQRTLSPVFLAGESYGGFRAAVLTQTLPEESGIAPSGAVLISPALEFGILRGEDYDLAPDMVELPSLAAVHLARTGVTGGDLEARLRPVERFAMGDYLSSLAAGPQAFPAAMTARLAAMTGMPENLVAQSYGRIPVGRFIKEYERTHGRVLSRYDGTMDGPDPDPASSYAHGADPVLDRATPVWTSAFVAYVRQELGYRTDVTYRLLDPSISSKWDYGTTPQRQGYAGALDDLQAGRTLNPALEVLIANGYTDLVTPYFGSRYLVDQLPPLSGAAPISLRVYPGGHMMYMRPGSRHALAGDAQALYDRALSSPRPPTTP